MSLGKALGPRLGPDGEAWQPEEKRNFIPSATGTLGLKSHLWLGMGGTKEKRQLKAFAGPGVCPTAPGICRTFQFCHLGHGSMANGHRARPAPRKERGVVQDLPVMAIV